MVTASMGHNILKSPVKKTNPKAALNQKMSPAAKGRGQQQHLPLTPSVVRAIKSSPAGTIPQTIMKYVAKKGR